MIHTQSFSLIKINKDRKKSFNHVFETTRLELVHWPFFFRRFSLAKGFSFAVYTPK